MQSFTPREIKRLERFATRKYRLVGLAGFVVLEGLALAAAGVKLHLAGKLAAAIGKGLWDVATTAWEGGKVYPGVLCMSRELFVEARAGFARADILVAFFFVGLRQARLGRKTLALIRAQQG
jgi:hypothetical protein